MKQVCLVFFIAAFALVLSSSAAASSIHPAFEYEHQDQSYAGIAHSFFGSSRTLGEKHGGLIYKSVLSGTMRQGGASTEAAYLTLAPTAPNGIHSSLVFDGPPTGKLGCDPHALIVFSPVPEPGSLTLLGTGLIGLATVIRWKFARA